MTRLRAVFVGLAAAALIGGGTGTGHTAPVTPVASPAENQAAQQAFLTQFGIATSVGGFGGTAVGAIIGCAVGGVITAPTIVFVPAGCLAGAVPGAGLGAIIGTIVVGGPALVVSGTELVQALTAAPGTTKWAPAS